MTLEANTVYTVSVYAAAYSSSYVNSSNNYDKIRFIYRPPGGSDTFSSYQSITGWVQNNNASANNNGGIGIITHLQQEQQGIIALDLHQFIMEIKVVGFGEHN